MRPLHSAPRAQPAPPAPAGSTAVVILAAGIGKRMRSGRPKVLHGLCGRPMLGWVLDQAFALDPDRVVVVTGHGGEAVEELLGADPRSARIAAVRQEPQLGTGHAVQTAAGELAGAARVVVLYGDMPALTGRTLQSLVAAQAGAPGGLALLTAWPHEPRGFGRIVRDEQGALARIVEERDASEAERALGEVNLGVYCFDGPALLDALPGLSNANRQGEYYLTDVVAGLVRAGRPVLGIELEDLDEAIGVNTLAQLSEARAVLQMRILERHLENGVEIEDPATTFVDHDVEIGAGTRLLPCTVIRAGVRIGERCEVGPFTQLRAGTVLEDGAEVGNFTECKNARLAPHVKAKHLAYLGDVSLGQRTNVGAGTIFANYDGRAKHPTRVGERVFLGSGTVVVAPNTIGDGATTGAGAVVTKDAGIGAGEVWVGVPAKPLAGRAGGSERP